MNPVDGQQSDTTCSHCGRDMTRNPFEMCSNGGYCVSITEREARVDGQLSDEQAVKNRYPGADFMVCTYRGPAVVDINSPGYVHLGEGNDESSAWADARAKLELKAEPLPVTATEVLIHEAENWAETNDVNRRQPTIDDYKDLVAAVYQFAGAMDAPVKWLDVLSAAANGEWFSTDGLLPFAKAEPPTSNVGLPPRSGDPYKIYTKEEWQAFHEAFADTPNLPSPTWGRWLLERERQFLSLQSQLQKARAEIQRLSQSQEQLLATGEGLAAQLEQARELLMEYSTFFIIDTNNLHNRCKALLAPKAEEIDRV
jgi:hypothetical protein